MIVSHISSPLCGKSNSINGHRVEDVLGRREASQSFHMVVMPAQQKVKAYIELLLCTMARDVRRVRYAKALPRFAIPAPGIYFINGETENREVEWCRQICPKSIVVEVGSIENIPRSIARRRLRRRVRPRRRRRARGDTQWPVRRMERCQVE
jgi:hypothetical protein